MRRMIKHNSYFDGAVQSLGFERNGRRQTVGVIAPGAVTFTTDAAERMNVVCGELLIRIAGGEWRHYPQGTAFEVPAKTAFDIKATAAAAYWCEFL